MEPRTFLRIEGVVAFVGALGTYLWLDGSLWLLAVLALAPDLAMLGYLAGPRVGSTVYNVAHTYTLPAALLGTGLVAEVPTAALVALVWAGHIGADRAVGYGLKYPSGFKDTHLATQPAPVAALREE